MIRADEIHLDSHNRPIGAGRSRYNTRRLEEKQHIKKLEGGGAEEEEEAKGEEADGDDQHDEEEQQQVREGEGKPDWSKQEVHNERGIGEGVGRERGIQDGEEDSTETKTRLDEIPVEVER
jgi:hypothetical protein